MPFWLRCRLRQRRELPKFNRSIANSSSVHFFLRNMSVADTAPLGTHKRILICALLLSPQDIRERIRENVASFDLTSIVKSHITAICGFDAGAVVPRLLSSNLKTVPFHTELAFLTGSSRIGLLPRSSVSQRSLYILRLDTLSAET